MMTWRQRQRWTNAVYWTLWAAVIALYLAWPLTHLEAYAWSNDEGLYVQRAALANAGYPLYTEILLNKPPLLVWILQLAFRVTGQTFATARLTCLFLSLLGFVAFGAVISQLGGRWAGLASAWVLLGLPEMPVRAHAVTSDLPALAFALVALGAALAFRHSRRHFWMVVLGAGYASALLIHPLLIYMILPLAAILFVPDLGLTSEMPVRRAGWTDLAVSAGTFLILNLLVFVAVDRPAFFSSVVGYNYRVTDMNVQLAAPAVNWDQIARYASQRWTLVWLAATGTAVLATSPAGRRKLVALGAWFLATLVTLLAWSPVWDHYLLFLAVPLAATAGGGLAIVGDWIVEGRENKYRRTCRMALVALTLVGTAIFIAERYGENMPQPEGGPEWSPDQLAARAFLETNVSPDGFVVADNPLLAFTAGRLVPPALTGASYKRIRSGYLTAEDLVASVVRYRAQAVLFATGRLALLPSFEPWIAAVAAGQRDFGPLRVYRLELPPSAPHAALSYLGSAIALDGYALSSDKLQAGNVLTVTLFWRREGPITENYHVFVHLVDDENHIWGQHDGPALMGAYPTAHWAEGLLLPDPHIVELGAGVLPGRYRLMAGMYRWPSLERLPALLPDGSRWPDDRIVLAEVYLTAPGTR